MVRLFSRKRVLCISLFLLCGLHVLSAQGKTLHLSFPDGIGKRGSTYTYSLYLNDSLTTTVSRYSGEFTITHNGTILTVIGIQKKGTLLDSVSSILFNPVTGKVSFAHTKPITGKGKLLDFLVSVKADAAGKTITSLQNILFNEGNISALMTNGSFKPMDIYISPKSPPQDRIVGDTIQFSVSGDVNFPVTWAVGDTHIVSIDLNGRAIGKNVGQTTVTVTDSLGLTDQSYLLPIHPATLRSLTVSIRDTSVMQNLRFLLPIKISTVTGLGITSAQFRLSYNSSLLIPEGVVHAGSLSQSWGTPTVLYGNGYLDVAMAGTHVLQDSGNFVFVKFKVKRFANFSDWITLSNVLFNENLNATVKNGMFSPIKGPVITISGKPLNMIRGETASLIASGGTAPYKWKLLSDTSIGQIDSMGLLRAKNKGYAAYTAIDVNGFDGIDSILISDVRFMFPDTTLVYTDSLDYPISISSVTGQSIISSQFVVPYDTAKLRFVTVSKAGTMTNNMVMEVKDSAGIRVALSGVTALTGTGTFIKLRFTAKGLQSLGHIQPMAMTQLLLNEAGPTNRTFTQNIGHIVVTNVPNIPPTFTNKLRDTTIAENQLLQFQMTASDANGDSLLFGIFTGSSGMAMTKTGLFTWKPNISDAGIHKVVYEVGDYHPNGVTRDSANITVTHVNRPPQFTKTLPDTSYMLDTMKLTFTYQGFDPDSDALTFTKLAGPSNSAITTNGIFTFTPQLNQIGIFPVSIQLSDGKSAIVRNALIVVNSSKSPKFTVTLPDTTIKVNQKISFQYKATSPNGLPLTFGKLFGPSDATVSTTGLLEWTPSAIQNNVLFIVGVTDGIGASLDTAFVSVVKNRPPQFTRFMPDTIIVDTMKLTYTYTAIDPDKDTLVFSLLSGPTGSVITRSGDFSWKPALNTSGVFTVIVGVSDGSVMVVDTARVVVAQSNNAPKFTMTLPDTTINVNQKLSFQYNAVDPNNAPLTYGLIIGPSGATVSLLGLLEWTPSSAQFGQALFIVGVTNGKGGALDTAYVSVAKLNHPPIFTTVLSDTLIEVNQKLSFQYKASDPDNDKVNFSFAASPANATISSNGLFEWTPNNSQVGKDTVIVTISDGTANVLDTAIITVSKFNKQPVFTKVLSDTTISEGQSLVFSYSATDPDNDSLLFVLRSQIPGMLLTTSGHLTWTPTFFQAGVYSILVSVKDNFFTVTDTAKITVLNVNRPPVFTSVLSDRSLSVDSTILFTYKVDDPDKDSIQFSIKKAPAGAKIFTNGTFEWKATAQDIGKDTIIISASDGTVSIRDTAVVSVFGYPIAKIITSQLDFGTLSIGETKRAAGIVKNIGTSPLVITLTHQQSLESEFFSPESISISILPNKQKEIGFKYSPQSVGVHSAQFITTTNDTFSLHGSATTTISISKKILVDVLHKPLINLRDSVRGIVPLLLLLTKSGIGVTFADTSFNPIGFDLVLIVQPQAAFSQPEVTALSKFVANGGTALLLGNSSLEGSSDLLNTVLSDAIWKTVDTSGVGISLQRDVVIDSVNNFGKISTNILLTSFTDPKHPYFSNVDSLVFFGSASLNVSGKAQPLIVSKGKSFNGTTFSEKPNPVVGAVQQIGKGRVLVFGDADQWRNLIAFDNLAFASNIFSVTENYAAKLPTKTPAEQYRMISIPFDLNATGITTVLKDIGTPGPYTWRLFGRWNNKASSYREFPSAGFSDFTRGEAYWLITKESKELQFGSATVTPAKEFYPIKIGPGYSMIGNPFPYSVSWKKSIRDSTERILWKFNGTGFDSVSDIMEPFAGYFVKSIAKDSITLYINPSDGKSFGKESSIQSSFAANEWNVNIKASSGKASDNFNIAGVSAAASDEWDIMDVSEPPPSPTDYLVLTFNRATWKYNPGSYAMDIRSVHEDGNYWDFTVTTAAKGSKVTLNLEKIGNLPVDYLLYLIDNKTERAYSATQEYTFGMSGSESQRSFRLVAGKKEYIEKNTNGIPLVPMAFELAQNFPNPFNPTTTIRYTLGHSADVALNIYNVLGQKVRTLVNDVHSIGSYEREWNGRNDAGILVASGVYFYHITARANGEQVFSESKKLVLMK